MKRTPDIVPHIDNLWRYARVLTRNDADADDLLQESLVRALSFAHAYDPERPVKAWMVAVVRNTFLTGVERRKAEERRFRQIGETAPASAGPAQENSTELSQVAAAFGRLPTEQAEVLHLVGVLGLSYKEAAEVMEVPIGTVMSRLNRARAALRMLLYGEDAQPRGNLRIAGGTDVAE